MGDRDRDKVVEILREAAGEGYISLDELTERIDRTYTARTRRELDDLVADLPQAAPPPAMMGAGAVRAGPVEAYTGDRLELHTGGGRVVRTGRWTVPPRISVRAGRWGTVKIDFMAADCPHAEVLVDVQITSWFGDVVIIVPHGWWVRDDEVVRRWLGAVHNRRRVPLAPGGVTVRLVGTVRTGDVWVRYRRPAT